MKKIILTILNLAWLLRLSVSFPSQAGGCNGGKAAVGESHLSNVNGFQELSLSDANVKIFIGTNEIQEGTRFGVLARESYPISVEGQFKGVLIRLETEILNTTVDLTPGTNAQVASVCEAPVVGITHLDNTIKSEFSGTLFAEELGGALLDITVVLQNNATGSIFAYGGFNILFVDTAPPAPTLAPTTVPTFNNAATNVTTPPSERQVCYVCGSDTLDVNPNLTTVFDGNEINCGELSQNGLQGLIDPMDCENATFVAQQDCECAPLEVSQPPAITTAPPTGATATAAPSTKKPTTAPIQTAAPSTHTPTSAPIKTPVPVPVPTKNPEPDSGDNASTDSNRPSGDTGDNECPSSKKSKSGKSSKSRKSSKCRKVKKKKSESKRSSKKIKKSKSKSSRRRLRASV
jgi:hypothetical protein